MGKRNHYILLVDDDQDDRLFMELSFKEIGWSKGVTYLTSGEAAIQYLNSVTPSKYPSLIVLDYNMPKMNGGTTLTYLKTHDQFKDIPVIIYSTGMTPTLRHQLITSGAASCFMKVEDHKKLVEMVHVFKLVAEGNVVFH
ncbi:MAG TPA: response regulator [Chitinophagaceae bacterium]|nr:response regulator [Chitinophagaceae bacterium]